VLACPPAIEAAVYASSLGADIYDDVRAIDIPVRVLRAAPRDAESPLDMSGSPTYPGLAALFPRGEDVPLPQYSHHMPMEDTAFVAGEVLRAS
jgi:hypothetical protein